MASKGELLMLDVLERLKSAPVIDDLSNIRRSHRTVVPREQTPAVHLVDGDHAPTDQNCQAKNELKFRVRIFTRNDDDDGYQDADDIAVAVLAALDPNVVSYGEQVDLLRGRIVKEQEIADADSLYVDMEFTFRFQTGEWALT
jgi:hypothetical protein